MCLCSCHWRVLSHGSLWQSLWVPGGHSFWGIFESLFFTQIAGSGNCKCSILTLKTDIVKQNPSSPLAVTVNIRDIRSDAIQSLVNVLTLLVYSSAACRMAPYSSVESGSFWLFPIPGPLPALALAPWTSQNLPQPCSAGNACLHIWLWWSQVSASTLWWSSILLMFYQNKRFGTWIKIFSSGLERFRKKKMCK